MFRLAARGKVVYRQPGRQLDVDWSVLGTSNVRYSIQNPRIPRCIRPPVLEVALLVKLAALIVKTVREFVPDGAAVIAIVGCVVYLWGRKWAAAALPPEN